MQSVPDPDWQRITSFFQAYVPRLHIDLPPLDVATWRKALKRFKPHAARGVDGISHRDLLAMPLAWTERLLQLLCKIELGHTPWPKALLYGVVSVIAKDPCSKTVGSFSPHCDLLCDLQGMGFHSLETALANFGTLYGSRGIWLLAGLRTQSAVDGASI